jgi:hypothetical protein
VRDRDLTIRDYFQQAESDLTAGLLARPIPVMGSLQYSW